MYAVILTIILAACTLTVPLAMLFGSVIMRSVCGERSSVVGYRTRLSLSSAEAWKYANSAYAQLWRRLGIVQLFAGPAAIALALWLIGPSAFVTDSGTAALSISVTGDSGRADRLDVLVYLAGRKGSSRKVRYGQ